MRVQENMKIRQISREEFTSQNVSFKGVSDSSELSSKVTNEAIS